MKESIIDKAVAFIDPALGLKRLKNKLAMDVLRNYDIASKTHRHSGWKRNKTTGSQEVSAAQAIAAASGQDLVRNNPSAKRIKRVLSARTVGTGIKAEISTKQKRNGKRKLKNLTERWDAWAESTECDFEGTHSLYGLQWLWMNTIVESGGVFIRKHVNSNLDMPLQLQTFEQSHLDRTKDTRGTKDNVEIIDGIQYLNGQITGYWLYKRPTETIGVYLTDTDSEFYPVEEVVHIFLKERAGQHIGMTWFDASAGVLRNYDIYEDAKLMQQQMAALFALIVEESPTAAGLNLKSDGSHELPDELEPGMIEYVKSGQTITTITPPKADNSTEFDIGLKQRMANGPGVTYEQMTGDYSRVNFASGRMGNVEFYAQLDIFQKFMLVPSLNKIFNWYMDLDNVSEILTSEGGGVYAVEWIFPPQISVEPGAEFDLIVKKVRNGMMSPRKAAKSLGENLGLIMEQWSDDKDSFGKLPFDIDPSMFSSAGNQLDVNTAKAAGATKDADTVTPPEDDE